MLLFDYILSENKGSFLNKYKNKPDVKLLVDKFWKIKSRISSPQNDIDWWIKQPYSEFKKFVTSFDTSKNKKIKRQDKYIQIAEEYGAKHLDNIKDPTGVLYEIWYVPTHEAAVQLGRFYKGISAKWCISTDNPYYFLTTYMSSEFLFLIVNDLNTAESEYGADPEFNKIAVQMEEDNITIFDINDNEITHNDSADITELVSNAVNIYNKKYSNLTRSVIANKLVQKYLNNKDWILDNIFKEASNVKFINNSWYCECNFQYILDLFPSDCQKYIYDIISGNDDILYYHPVVSNNLWEIDPKIIQMFNHKLEPFGITWDDIQNISNDINNNEKISTRIENIISYMIESNFCDGLSYYDIYCNATETAVYKYVTTEIINNLKQYGGMDLLYKSDSIYVKCMFSIDKIKYIINQIISGYYNDYDYDNKINFVKTPIFFMAYDSDKNNGFIDFDEPPLIEPNTEDLKYAIINFSNKLIGELTKQKDSPGQLMFPFDDAYIDNPDNLDI